MLRRDSSHNLLLKPDEEGLVEGLAANISERVQAQPRLQSLNEELAALGTCPCTSAASRASRNWWLSVSSSRVRVATRCASHDLLQPLNAARLLLSTLRERQLNKPVRGRCSVRWCRGRVGESGRLPSDPRDHRSVIPQIDVDETRVCGISADDALAWSACCSKEVSMKALLLLLSASLFIAPAVASEWDRDDPKPDQPSPVESPAPAYEASPPNGLHPASASTVPASTAITNSAGNMVAGIEVARRIFSARIGGKPRRCDAAVIDFPRWEGFPVQRCDYYDTGVRVKTYMLNPSIYQLSRWTVTACKDAGALNMRDCVSVVAETIITASTGVFPVSGFIPEPAKPAGRHSNQMLCLLFRDGVTVHSAQFVEAPAAVNGTCPSVDHGALVTRAMPFARVASTTRDEYRAHGGAIFVGTDGDGSAHWLDVVRKLYQRAWTSERNELISAKAVAMHSQHLFE